MEPTVQLEITWYNEIYPAVCIRTYDEDPSEDPREVPAPLWETYRLAREALIEAKKALLAATDIAYQDDIA